MEDVTSQMAKAIIESEVNTGPDITEDSNTPSCDISDVGLEKQTDVGAKQKKQTKLIWKKSKFVNRL